MSNSYFRFKQFTVQQDRSAMKVSTDACIQGAWTPCFENVKKVLDVGAGTGLLSLMLAQRFDKVSIDAVELDENAASQAAENVTASPWGGRINIIHGDATQFEFQGLYDMVICNPPFFRNSLKGTGNERNMARHDMTLGYEDLLGVLNTTLDANGYACVLLPYTEHLFWEQLLAGNGWHVFHKLVVSPRATLQPNRVVSLCRRGRHIKTQHEHLCIYNIGQSYTGEFRQLMAPFYLQL